MIKATHLEWMEVRTIKVIIHLNKVSVIFSGISLVWNLSSYKLILFIFYTYRFFIYMAKDLFICVRRKSTLALLKHALCLYCYIEHMRVKTAHQLYWDTLFILIYSNISTQLYISYIVKQYLYRYIALCQSQRYISSVEILRAY